MKKSIKNLLLLLVMLATMLALAACDGKGTPTSPNVTTPVTTTNNPDAPPTCTHVESDWIVDKNETCGEAGSKHTECTVCHTTMQTEVIPATEEHTESGWHIDKNATCVEAGSKHTECTVCHTTMRTEAIPATGEHSYKDDVCQNCGNELASNGLLYTLNADGMSYSVSVGTCTDADIIIPKKYNRLPVTHIASFAFDGCSFIKSVLIPDSITTIERSAFSGCSQLIGITIPNSVTNIGSDAFYGCYKLVEVYNLSNLFMIKGISSNGYVAYYALIVYTSAEIPSKLWTDANGYIFYENGDTCYLVGYTGSESVLTLPENCNGKNYDIYKYAFDNCSSLTSITIPDSVTRIGDYAFDNCSSLTSVYITDIEAWSKISFDSSSSNPLYNGANLYLNNALVTELTIPDSVTNIGNDAFYGCSSLTSIVIPDSVTNIGARAFLGCSSLTSVTFGENSQLKSIGNYAFSDCSNLTSIVIPDRVTNIGIYAFSDCSNLTSIVIPDRVTNIGNSAFSGCSKLESITLPFVGASKDGTSNTHFGYIFGASSFDDNYDYVPTSLKTVVITGGSSIGSKAFDNCSSLTSIVISDSVTNIGNYAFYGCSSLTSVTFGENSQLKRIDTAVFSGCSSLTSIVISDSVTNIDNSAFSGCSSLTSVTFGENSQLKRIGSFAFYGCSSLTSIVIPDRVTNIGNSTFSDCSSLSTVYYGGTASDWSKITIGHHNTNLTSATIYYYSETESTTTGNYWHYVNGVPTKW